MNALEALYSEELTDERVLKRYYTKSKARLYDFFVKNMDRLPYFGRLRIGLAKLPTYIALVKEWGRVKLRPIGKVFGLYSPETNTILIDPVVMPELDDPERAWLRKYMDIPSGESVLGHEMVHSDQANTGLMDRLYRKYGQQAREYVEGAASYICDAIFGKSGCYGKLKAWFGSLVEKSGLKRAYQS